MECRAVTRKKKTKDKQRTQPASEELKILMEKRRQTYILKIDNDKRK